MAQGARVNDVDVIRAFRATLVKFIEAGGTAVTDAEGEILKKMAWLEQEQEMYWTQAIRKLQDMLVRAKEQLRMKKLFKDSSGRTASAVDEEKQVKMIQAKLLEAEQKQAATKRYAKQLQRDHLMYRGGVQRLQTMLSSDLPNAVAMLEAAVVKLDQYMAAAPVLTTSDAGAMAAPAGAEGSGDENMKRAAEPDAEENKVDAPADAAGVEPAEAAKELEKPGAQAPEPESN
ncbi:MAG: hypothetical protein ACTHM6_07390 [Tepidisphaeraceae bacterium]